MGPRHWSRGRVGDGQSYEVTIFSLQWGHDTGVVEEQKSPGKHLWRTDASMGPRHWSRGREPPGATCRIAICRLFRERVSLPTGPRGLGLSVV